MHRRVCKTQTAAEHLQRVWRVLAPTGAQADKGMGHQYAQAQGPIAALKGLYAAQRHDTSCTKAAMPCPCLGFLGQRAKPVNVPDLHMPHAPVRTEDAHRRRDARDYL